MTDLLQTDHAAVTVLTNRPLRTGWADSDPRPMLPLARGMKLYVEGIDPAVAAEYGEVVATPAEADAAILRLHAPFEQLEFPAGVIDHVHRVAAAVPTVVDVFADRPAILEPLVDDAAAVTVHAGADAAALLDVLTGAADPQGRLPFDLPRSVTAGEASRSGALPGRIDPLFRSGHGLDL